MAISASPWGRLILGGRTFGEHLLCHCLLPTSLLTNLQQTGLFGGIDAAVSCSPYHSVFLPGARRLDGSSWSFGGFEEAQRLTHDLTLHFRLPRMTAGIAKRKVREIEPWNTAIGRKLARSFVWVDSLSQATLSVNNFGGGGETWPDHTRFAPSKSTGLAVVINTMRDSESGLASCEKGTSSKVAQM